MKNIDVDIEEVLDKADGAYSESRYKTSDLGGAQWYDAIKSMVNLKMDEDQIVWTLRSKHMRWMADQASSPCGNDIVNYLKENSNDVLDDVDRVCKKSLSMFDLIEKDDELKEMTRPSSFSK